MATSSSSSDYYDTKDAISESSSQESTSVEYFSCEDNLPDEDTTSWGDMTSNRGSLLHLLPPIKGTKGQKNKGTPIFRHYQVQDEPKQDPKISIALAWDDEDPESAACTVERLVKMLHACLEKLKDGEGRTQGDNKNQKHEEEINKKDKISAFSEAAEGEKCQLCDRCPLHIAQVGEQGSDSWQEAPRCRSPRSEGIIQVRGMPLMFKEQDLAETVSQSTDSQRVSTTETAWPSSLETEEAGAPDTQATPCLSLRRALRWVRQRVLCCLQSRGHPE